MTIPPQLRGFLTIIILSGTDVGLSPRLSFDGGAKGHRYSVDRLDPSASVPFRIFPSAFEF